MLGWRVCRREGFEKNVATPKRQPEGERQRIITITTGGETLPDGSMIELVSDSTGSSQPELLLWNGTKARIARRINYGAIALTRQLSCTRVGDLFKNSLDCPIVNLYCSRVFVLCTWLADRLSMAPSLANLRSRSRPLGVDVLRLIHCLCRLPLSWPRSRHLNLY